MEYHKTDLHYRLLKSIALNIELLYNDRDFEISEYDIQAIMSLFLKKNFVNSDFAINRESFGKYDCAISEKNSRTPIVLYELKTFVKPNEKLNIESAYKKVESDLFKLKSGIGKYKKSRAYFILVCKNKDVDKVNFIDKFNFIKGHLDDSRKWIELTKKKDKLKIRPSRKVRIERIYTFSWEIK